MAMYVVTVLIYIGIFANYFLGYKLYKEPSNSGYFSNVNHYNTINGKDIMASPKYVAGLSILLGLFGGAYLLLCELVNMNSLLKWITVAILFVLYLIEISRKITLNDDSLELEKLFSATKKIPLNDIDGMFVYSYNKKFLNKRAFTTKLIVASGKKRYKFTLSSIDVKSVMNMMKDNFGITENKMYVAKK